MNVFNVSLEVLQEISEHALTRNWPLIQMILATKICHCYWNLNMHREYLRKTFEIISFDGLRDFFDEAECEKIRNASIKLDDVFPLDFDKFFSVKDLTIDASNDLLFINIDINSSFIMVETLIENLVLKFFSPLKIVAWN